ncbi:primosomal protein [Actinokineospora bangkokensis]|uniref:Primosomal protein n=1 Tax=Actinokineospora bangkokensis TaxID=1193682 RepID=A0A1Q9LEP2_9PSEU|nr:primosomal protein [Actinokineospora bangkokensis]OLR90507.1 primosomal protein [Actinokineospora bangkokensis]
MAQDIVPIELGLPQGDVVTLWAPRWREDGEEWEAFLGHEDDLYAFPDAAHLAAFVRTAGEHDLSDHPAWHLVPALSVAELMPDDAHQYDLVGVPELVAEEPDTWTVGELADIVAIVRSLADVCELEEVHEVLDAAAGFAVLDQGTFPFTGRDGERLWTDLAETISERWDEVLDALDAVVAVPEVDAAALATSSEELAAFQAETEAAEAEDADTEDAEATGDEDDDAEEAPVGFWGEVGIDPIKIIVGGQDYYTLRCYLDDEPVFLGTDGKIDVARSARGLGKYLATEDLADNDLAEVSTWEEVATKATDGSLDIEVDTDNTYVLEGLGEDLAEGVDAVDPVQLDLAVELLTDAADWAEDDSVGEALNQSESLGWLVSFILAPDPTRMAPSPPFDAESEAWNQLVQTFENRLTVR